MKRPLLSLLALTSSILLVSACKATKVAITQASDQRQAPYQAAHTKYHDLLHTKLEVSVDWQRRHLHGLATLKLRPHCFSQTNLVLDAQGFVVYGVAILVEQTKIALEYTYDGKQLTIDLGKALRSGEEYWVEIAYIVQPNEIPACKGRSLSCSQGLFFINPDGTDSVKPQQVWTFSQRNTTPCWFPTINAPNQRCTQEVYITVDERFKTVSNGVLGYSKLNEDHTRTDYWHMDLPHAPYLCMLAVGEFSEVQDEWRDIEVNYYVEPTYKRYATAIFGHTPEMLEFFSQKLDYPYPWPKYSQIVVRDYIADSMENTSAVVFSDELQMDDRQLVDRDYDDIIARKLFNHWFGNLVACESWTHCSLNEAFACLGVHIWREHKYGSYAGDLHIWHILQDYLQEVARKPTNPIYNNSCNKGALILHMLRQYLGEEIFFKALSYYLKKHAFSYVEVHQLRKAFEDVTGEDLNWFFNQWFFSAGHPVLKVAHTYNDGILTLKVWQQQNVRTTPLYKLPLTVAIWMDGKKQHREIVVTQQYNEFKWKLPCQPGLVSLDRRTMLLGVIGHTKSATEYQNLYAQGENFFEKQEALMYCGRNMHSPGCCRVLQDAMQDYFWFFRQMAVNAFKGYKGKDLPSVKAQIIELSKKDIKSSVRASAVCTLASFQDPAQYIDIYKQGMTDASYHLASTALHAYATTSDEPDKLVRLANFEACDNPRIITALANYYIEAKQPAKYAWLKEKLIRLQDSREVRSLILVLGRYLAVIPDEESQAHGLNLFKKLATGTKKEYIQSAVHEALQQMRKIKGARALLSELKANEQPAN